jgi:hypothetical protein
VLAHGQRLGQRGQVGVERVGHREEEHLLERHVLGQRAGVVVGVADLLDAGRPQDDGHRADPGADREGGGGVGAVLDDLGAELVPEDAVGRRVERGTPTESISPVKWAKSASACRSEPQMPAASERTTTWPEPGVGSATSPTTSCPPLVTAARISTPPGRIDRRPDRRYVCPVSFTQDAAARPFEGRWPWSPAPPGPAASAGPRPCALARGGAAVACLDIARPYADAPPTARPAGTTWPIWPPSCRPRAPVATAVADVSDEDEVESGGPGQRGAGVVTLVANIAGGIGTRVRAGPPAGVPPAEFRRCSTSMWSAPGWCPRPAPAG